MRKNVWATRGTTLCLREFKGRVLGTPDEIFEALDAGKLMLGQTELRNPETGRTAVIEYPIKTINWHRDQKIWQVDTGPLLLPDLSVPAEEWSATIQLAYIVFNVPEWADFVVEQITPITEGEQEVAQVYHYSGIVHKDCRNVLIAMDEDTR